MKPLEECWGVHHLGQANGGGSVSDTSKWEGRKVELLAVSQETYNPLLTKNCKIHIYFVSMI